ncbi:hypothetical protein ACFQ9X_22460 [Catenulispora yoronensis]
MNGAGPMPEQPTIEDVARDVLAAYRTNARQGDANRDLPAIAAIMVLRWTAWSHAPSRSDWQTVKKVAVDQRVLAGALEELLHRQALSWPRRRGSARTCRGWPRSSGPSTATPRALRGRLRSRARGPGARR